MEPEWAMFKASIVEVAAQKAVVRRLMVLVVAPT